MSDSRTSKTKITNLCLAAGGCGGTPRHTETESRQTEALRRKDVDFGQGSCRIIQSLCQIKMLIFHVQRHVLREGSCHPVSSMLQVLLSTLLPKRILIRVSAELRAPSACREQLLLGTVWEKRVRNAELPQYTRFLWKSWQPLPRTAFSAEELPSNLPIILTPFMSG